MCGRYFLEIDIKDILSMYGVKEADSKQYMKGEIYPGTNIPVILKEEGRKLDYFRWGFKVRGLNKEVINARIETVSEKSSFRRSFKEKRCIIPANSFFEWHVENKIKTKYNIALKTSKLFSIAALYDDFVAEDGIMYRGVVILTRAANDEMSKIHHRMPVIIDREAEEEWLSDKFLGLKGLEERLENLEIPLKITPADGIKQMTLF